MNRNLCREVAGCLRVAGPVDEHLSRLRKFRVRDWETSLNWLHLSGLALTFWDRLLKLGEECAVPPQVGACLAANLAEHRLRIEAMTPEFDDLNRRFEQAGIRSAVWKGFALVPSFCPDACLRPSYDYDYLMDVKDLPRAQEVLQAAGYVFKPPVGVEHHVTFVPPLLHPKARNGPDGYYAATVPRKVELHPRLWDNEVFRIPLRIPDGPLDRALRRDWQGLSFNSLAEEDALLFQALHAFRQILYNWCRLGWLWEIAYFLEHRSHDTSFWVKFQAHLAGNERLAEIVAVIFTLADLLFHATLPAPLQDWIPGAMRGQTSQWIDHYGMDSALDNFAENKYVLFLYREFVPDEATWRQIRRSRLLPLHRPTRVAGVARPATSTELPPSWRQSWHVVERMIHHSVSGARYVWESARWRRLRRLSARRALS